MDVSEKVVESEHKDQGNMSTKPGEMNVQHKTRTFQVSILEYYRQLSLLCPYSNPRATIVLI